MSVHVSKNNDRELSVQIIELIEQNIIYYISAISVSF